MLFELLRISIALVGSLIAGIWDLKTTNIPDSVIVGMIVLALVINGMDSYMTNDVTPILASFVAGGIFFLFSILMYYTGQWGGGDGGLLTAIGFLLPISSSIKTFFPFSLSFFINMLFIGVVYSIVYAFIMAMNSKDMNKKLSFEFKKHKRYILISTIAVIALSVLSFSSIIFVFPFLVFLLAFVTSLLFKFLKVIESGFYREIPVSKLNVDDMIGEDIPKLMIYKNYLRGLTEDEVRKIKSIRKSVIIRTGISYGMVFPIALIFTLLLGDFFFVLNLFI